jgi:hypothetical protein
MAPGSEIDVIEMVTQSRLEDLLFPDANSFLPPLDTEERCASATSFSRGHEGFLG